MYLLFMPDLADWVCTYDYYLWDSMGKLRESALSLDVYQIEGR